MLVSKSIPNLVNGISQQPDSLRLPTQAEIQENMYSSVVEGLMDRPPTEYIARLYTGSIGDAFTHLINRDTTERYEVLVRNGDLTVHTLAGVAKTVNFPDGKTYLTTTTPSSKIKAITVSDYTFIVNLEKVVVMDAALTTTRPKEALVFVKQGAYGSDYKVFIDGVQKAIKTTSTSVVTDIATNAIAEDLRADLVTSLGAGWTITRYGSVVSIVKTSGDFKITCEDSQGGASLVVFKDSTQSFTSLPTVAPTDFQIKIVGQPESDADDYYVKFVPSTAGETFGEGQWEEAVAMGIQYKFDAATMPHILVRNVDGTFTFSKATWDQQTVGDANTAPQPSFVGTTIRDVFFFKNRLCFLAQDAVVGSRIGDYFNFWPLTTTTVRDDDRFDYTVSHTKPSLLNHAVPFNEKVVLFSDQTQFIFQGGATLTSKTIQCDPTTEFENVLTAKPVAEGKNVYFAVPNGRFNGVREYFVDQTTEVKDATNVTAHVPKYIPTGAFKLAASSTENILVVLTSGETHAVYIYKYFYSGDEKLQSSWSVMHLGNSNTKVLGIDFIESVAYVVVQRADGVYLEKMNFAPGATDAVSDTIIVTSSDGSGFALDLIDLLTGFASVGSSSSTTVPGGPVNFVTHYDRLITEAECTSVTYDAGTDQTIWELPYQVDGTMKVVTRGETPGQLIALTYQSGTTIKATGDHTLKSVFIGQTYMRRYRFSKFYLREENKDGAAIVLQGRLQLRTATLAYADTGTFTVTVAQDFRNPNTYVQYRDPADAVFTGRVLGAGSNLLGAVALATGDFKFPILSKNDQVIIEITSDSFLPMHLLSLDWEGLFHARSRRV